MSFLNVQACKTCGHTISHGVWCDGCRPDV